MPPPRSLPLRAQAWLPEPERTPRHPGAYNPVATGWRRQRLRGVPERGPRRNGAYTLDGGARLAYPGRGARSRRRLGRCNGSGGRTGLRPQGPCAR